MKGVNTMGKTLVTYFSVSGVSKAAAERIAKSVDADIAEIAPKARYSNDDVNYQNPESRSCKENADQSCRPEIEELTVNVADYDTVFVGFPIWWNVEPRAVDTFLEKYDLSGKNLVPFATSGGSTIAGAMERIKSLVKDDVTVKDGKIIVAQDSDTEIEEWAKASL